METRKRKYIGEIKQPIENKKQKMELDLEVENAGLYFRDNWPQVLESLNKEQLRRSAAPINRFFHRLSTSLFDKAPWPDLNFSQHDSQSNSLEYGDKPKIFTFKDGSFAAGLEDGEIHFWNLRDKEPQLLKGHKKRIINVFLLQNGDIVTHSKDKTINIWDRKSFTKKHTLSRFQARQSDFHVAPLENNDLMVWYQNGQIEIFDHNELWQKWKIICPREKKSTSQVTNHIYTWKNLIIAEQEIAADKKNYTGLVHKIKIWNSNGDVIKEIQLEELEPKLIESLQKSSTNKITKGQYYFSFCWKNLPPGLVLITAEYDDKESLFLLNLMSDLEPILIAHNKELLLTRCNKDNELIIAVYDSQQIDYLVSFNHSTNQFQKSNSHFIHSKPEVIKLLSDGNLFFGSFKKGWHIWKTQEDTPTPLKLEAPPIVGAYRLRSTDRDLSFSNSNADGIIFWDDDGYLIWDNPTGKFKLDLKLNKREFYLKQLMGLSNGDLITLPPDAGRNSYKLNIHRFGLFHPDNSNNQELKNFSTEEKQAKRSTYK